MLLASQVETPSREMTMKFETGTFELRDNDMMMRELTSAETNEVAGGLGLAVVLEIGASGPGSSQTISGSNNVVTTNTSAFASLNQMISATGTQNLLEMFVFTIAVA
jgi:hypothetical protein